MLDTPVRHDSDGLAAALADYLSRLDRGESVGREAFLEQHPEHRAALQEYFANVDLIERLATGSANGTAEDAATPRRFGEYDLLCEIGRGGMGVVYQAQERSTGRLVALKMILHRQFATSQELRRFQNEACTAANFNHPHVMPIFHVGEHQGHLFYTMPLVSGHSLAERLADGPLDPQLAAKLMLQVADAVAYAHARDVVHRDLKPANILLDEHDKPYVADFGLARQFGEASLSLTATGDLLGTPNYMAPEQVNGSHTVGTAADIYALGAVLYALLVGHPPFQSASISETLHNIATSDPVRPRQLKRRVPRDLETICLKCLEKSPANRYASAGELADDLRRFLAGEPLLAQRVSHVERCRRWFVRNPVIGTLAVGIALALLGGAGLSLHYAGQAHQGEQQALANLYAADMNLAQQHVRAGAVANAIRLLERHRPASGVTDPRGWEWHHLWHVCHGELRRFEGPHGAVYAAAFSPDGRTVAAAAADRTVWLWETATGNVERKLAGHKGTIRALAFSPNGSRLATVDEEGIAIVWNVDAVATGGSPVATTLQPSTGEPPVATIGDNTSLTAVSFSCDGLIVATGGNNEAKVNLWDARTCTLVQSLDLGPAECLAFAPHDSRLAIASGDGCVRLCKPDENGTWSLAETICGHSGIVRAVCWSSDGSRLASAGEDRVVKIWDTNSGSELTTIGPFTEQLYSIAFSPDGQRLAMAARNEPLRVWDLEQQQFVAELLGHTALATSVAFCPDGWRLVSASEDGTVRLWDAAQYGDHDKLEGHLGKVRTVAFQPGGSLLASGSVIDGTVILWDAVMQQPIRILRSQLINVTGLDFSPCGNYLAAAGVSGRFRIFDVKSGAAIHRLELNSEPISGIDWAPNGYSLAVQSENGTVHLIDPVEGRIVLSRQTSHPPAGNIAFSSDGQLLATSGGRQAVYIWESRKLSPACELSGHTMPVSDVTFSPNDSTVCWASTDYVIRLGDSQTGHIIRAMHGHLGTPLGLSFSPNGRRLASGGTDKTVKIWDLASGMEVQSLLGNSNWVRDVAFSTDGQRIASAGYDGTVRIWHATALTTNWRSTREAAALVHYLAARFPTRKALVTAIVTDASVSKSVRKEAYRQASNIEFHWQSTIAGHRAAQRRDWESAIQAFEQVTNLEPTDPQHWQWLALANFAAGRRIEYEHACQQMLNRCRDSSNEVDVNWCLMTWLLSPRDPSELEAALPILSAAQSHLSQSCAWLHTLRGGALPFVTLDTANPPATLGPHSEDWFVLALAWHAAGNTDRAQEAYAVGEYLHRTPAIDWRALVYPELLRLEVREVLTSKLSRQLDSHASATSGAASTSGPPTAADIRESAPMK